jgi:hypothetical protein
VQCLLFYILFFYLFENVVLIFLNTRFIKPNYDDDDDDDDKKTVSIHQIFKFNIVHLNKFVNVHKEAEHFFFLCEI